MQCGLYQYPDENKARLPVSVNRFKEIPPQISSKEEAQMIDSAKTSTQLTTAGTTIVQFVSNFFLKASLNQLWSLINSL